MSLLRPSRLATMLGLGQGPRSPRTSPPERSRSRAPNTSTRKATLIASGTTELTRLRGLETVEQTAHEPRAAGGPGEYGKLMLFSGRSNPDLADAIAGHLGLKLGDVDLKTFTNGESYCRYNESV